MGVTGVRKARDRQLEQAPGVLQLVCRDRQARGLFVQARALADVLRERGGLLEVAPPLLRRAERPRALAGASISRALVSMAAASAASGAACAAAT